MNEHHEHTTLLVIIFLVIENKNQRGKKSLFEKHRRKGLFDVGEHSFHPRPDLLTSRQTTVSGKVFSTSSFAVFKNDSVFAYQSCKHYANILRYF